MADDTAMDVDPDQGIFASVAFTIVERGDLAGERAQQVRRVLEENGASFIPLNPGTGRIDNITEYTHIVSNTSDFPDYFLALDHFVHVVKPQWIDDSLRRNKAVNPRTHSPDPCLFFSDVIVTCAPDIPEGDKEAIIGGVLAMGGQYSGAVTKLTTHIVALTLENDKCELARAKKLRCKIVLPHWFDDCLKLGRKIVETPYELPHPQILSVSNGPIAHYPSDAIKGATTHLPTGLPTPTSFSSSETRVLDVFLGKKIMLSNDLFLGARIQGTIEQLVRTGGGKLVDDVDDCDTYVCMYRDGQDYVRASQAGKDVGNLSWLYYLITHNVWTSPMRRLLHYPVPRNGIPGFSAYRISISNYVGEARVYLENLTKACGAEFTKVFRQDNSHLITAHSQSEKCSAAKEWGVHLVNHMWLEESYAKCKEQSLTNPRYTHFPSRTNLGEVVGRTQVDREAVEKNFFKAPAATTLRKEAQSPVKDAAPMDDLTEDDHEDGPHPKLEDDLPVQMTSTKKSKRGKNNNTDTLTPARIRDNKENETPLTGGRGAKSKARAAIHDLAPDIAQYEKEMKRKGGVIHGGRRVSEPEGAEKESKSKGTLPGKRSLEPEDEEDVSTTKGAQRKSKKAKAEVPSVVHRLMLSGDERWTGKGAKNEAGDKNKLRAIGIHITENPDEVTILCAPRIVRTRKFVAALSNAPLVVNTKFVDYCLKEKKLPPLETYALKDREGEARQGINLVNTIARAKQNRHQLLNGWEIFVTEGVNGGWETFKDIITANGGVCMLWKGRATAVSKRKKIKVDKEGDTEMESDPASDDDLEANCANDEGDTLYLISGTTPEDHKLWPKFRDMAKKAGMKPRIVKPDWILFVAMSQSIAYEDHWALRDEDIRVPKPTKG